MEANGELEGVHVRGWGKEEGHPRSQKTWCCRIGEAGGGRMGREVGRQPVVEVVEIEVL